MKLINSQLFLCLALYSCFNLLSCSKKTTSVFQNESLPTTIGNSKLSIPVHITTSDLNSMINKLVEKHLSSPMILDNGYRTKIQVQKNITFEANDNKLKYGIPLAIEIFPSAEINSVKADGVILLEMSTILNLLNNKIISKTEYVKHSWIQSPSLKILGLPIPIGPIAEAFINKFKPSLCKTIDENIAKSFDANAIKSKLDAFFANPLFTSDDNIIGLYASPSQFAIGPFSMQQDELIIPVMIDGEAVIAEKKPSDLINNLNFEIQPSYDNISELQIQSRVPMQYIEQLCREGVENQSYGSGLTKITVQKIKLNGYKETLQVRLHTLGAYDGELELSFIPRFNSSKKLIQLEEFRIASISGKKLDKTIFNLVQGIIQNKLKSTMEDFFNATIQDYVKSATTLLEGKEIMQTYTISGKLLDYNISNFAISDSRMYFNLVSKFSGQLRVKEF